MEKSPLQAWGLQWKSGVPNKKLGVSDEKLGVSDKNLESLKKWPWPWGPWGPPIILQLWFLLSLDEGGNSQQNIFRDNYKDQKLFYISKYRVTHKGWQINADQQLLKVCRTEDWICSVFCLQYNFWKVYLIFWKWNKQVQKKTKWISHIRLCSLILWTVNTQLLNYICILQNIANLNFYCNVFTMMKGIK